MLLFLIFTGIFAVITSHLLFTMVLGMISFLVPLMLWWMGQRISAAYTSHKTYENFFRLVDNKKSGRYITNSASEEFVEMLGDAVETLQEVPPRAYTFFKKEIQDLRVGKYVIATPHAIYVHHVEFLLNVLQEGEVFQTSHVHDKNKQAELDENGEGNAVFEHYINAHCKAANNKGVLITRIYIFESYATIPKSYWIQMSKLKENKVTVKILLERRIGSEIEKRDITIIGKKIIGVVDSSQAVNKCEYTVLKPSNTETFYSHKENYNQLHTAAKDLKDVVEKYKHELPELTDDIVTAILM